MKPVVLSGNQLHRFYAGGQRIAELRGIPSTDDHAPEDWVGSTATLFGETTAGLSKLDDGRVLRDVVEADPEAFLGPDHVAAFGADPGLLVKLLDAGERLPVHAHPGREFARRHLDCPYGKTEAWVIVSADPGAVVHLGFTRDVAAAELTAWVSAQDSAAMLAAMHAVPVGAGDAVLVPAGMPHAIGAGILLVELQEPTDFSVLMEWAPYEIDGTVDGHLGLGFETALAAVDRSGWAPAALSELRSSRPQAVQGPREILLPAAADPFFRAERLTVTPSVPTELDAGFSILVVLDGCAAVGDLEVDRGATVLVPFAAGVLPVTGEAQLVCCRPSTVGPDSTGADHG